MPRNLLKSIAKWYSQNNRDDEAEDYYLKAIQVHSACEAEDISHYAESLKSLAQWYEEEGRLEAAGECYLRAYSEFTVCSGADYGSYSCFIGFLTQLYVKLGQMRKSAYRSSAKYREKRVLSSGGAQCACAKYTS